MPPTDEERDALIRIGGKADASRAAGLQLLGQAVRARQAGLQREHGRLSRKLGPDHPRTRATAMRIEADAALSRELVVDIARAATVRPQRTADQWALHGLVLCKDLRPAPGLTVSLVDAKGEWLKFLGFACTDARGYFQLVAPGARTSGTVDAPPDAYARSALEAWIRVTDADRNEVHRETPRVHSARGGIGPGGGEGLDQGGSSFAEEAVKRLAGRRYGRARAARAASTTSASRRAPISSLVPSQ